jgi:hypothetical protein
MHVTGWALSCSDQSEAVRSDIKGRRRRRKARGQRELELELELGWGHGGAEERVWAAARAAKDATGAEHEGRGQNVKWRAADKFPHEQGWLIWMADSARV